jgi:glycosyltransferase involved in cell wall biosynthesis
MGMTSFSIIMPVRNGASTLGRALDAIRRSSFRDFEIIVVDDGSTDGSALVAERHGARVIRTSPRGPAAARNSGAALATGEILLFIDADCEVHSETLTILATAFATSRIAAAFGSYDDAPAARGLITEAKNLQHHYVHQHGSREAGTFWSGCGAVRRDVFFASGGFDAAAYPLSSIEDIELGTRLRAAGHVIALIPDARVKHLKRWTARELVMTDLFRRAIPWTRLMLTRTGMSRDLNLNATGKLSGATAAAAFLLAGIGIQYPVALGASASAFAVLIALNLDFYAFLRRKRGILFATAAVPLHILWYGLALTGFALGVVSLLGGRLVTSQRTGDAR